MLNFNQSQQAKILREELDRLIKLYMDACKMDKSLQVKKEIRIQIRRVEEEMGNVNRIGTIRLL